MKNHYTRVRVTKNSEMKKLITYYVVNERNKIRNFRIYLPIGPNVLFPFKMIIVIIIIIIVIRDVNYFWRKREKRTPKNDRRNNVGFIIR